MHNKGRETAGIVVLSVLALVVLLPFAIMFVTALHVQGSFPSGFEWPREPQWHNFADAFVTSRFIDLAMSSATIVLTTVPLALLFATLGGYALGQLRVPGGPVIMLVFLLGMTIPFESAIVPLYYQAQGLGTINTTWAVSLPLIGWLMPFGLFWMRGQFAAIPRELSEAASLDGASTWTSFVRIHLPLVSPAIATLALLQFLAAWNSFLLPVVMIDDPTQRTMAGALAAFQGEHQSDIVLMSAVTVLLTAPTLAVFLALQRHFVRALLAGSLK